MSKPYNGGAWTQARFEAFIKGLIRSGLQKWGPKIACIKNARVRRGWYKCEGCKEEVPTSIMRELKTRPGEWKRTKNIYADHIQPIVDPAVGRRSWDEVIERAFVELDGYQALCYKCHEDKTTEEKAISTERKRTENGNNNNEE
jgi:hypothetical protein